MNVNIAKEEHRVNVANIKAYPYQVAGHFEQALKLTADGLILKPVQRPPKGDREVAFYNTIFSEKEEREDVLQLRKLLPKYHGIIELPCEDGLTFRFIMLETITRKFSLPCVIDMKIGQVTWEDDAPENIKERKRGKWPLKKISGFSILGCLVGKVTWEDDAPEQFKERRRKKWPLTETTGFSILGLMVYNHKKHCYERYNQEWYRAMATLEEVKQETFVTYLKGVSKNLRCHVVEGIIDKLLAIKQWFLTQRLYRFIASSILIVYEGSTANWTTSSGNPSDHPVEISEETPEAHNSVETVLVEARMIDMAHVFETSDLDKNYLFGLDNAISLFQNFRDMCRVKSMNCISNTGDEREIIE